MVYKFKLALTAGIFLMICASGSLIDWPVAAEQKLPTVLKTARQQLAERIYPLGIADCNSSGFTSVLPITVDQRVDRTTEGPQPIEDATALPNGGFVLVWNSFDSSVRGVYMQIFGADGAKLTSEIQVNIDETGDQRFAGAAALSNGNIAVVFESNGEAYMRLFQPDGAPLGGEVQVNTFTNFLQVNPKVAALANGGFIVVWESQEQDGEEFGIYGQRYDASGNRAGAEFRVNDFTNGTQRRPEAIGLSNGNFVAMFDSEGPGDFRGIFAKVYDGNGLVIKSQFRVNTTTLDGQEQANATEFPNGDVLIAWTDQNDGGRAQLFTSSGNPVGSEINLRLPRGVVPLVAALNDCSFIAVWARDIDITAKIYDRSGVENGVEFRVNSSKEGLVGQARPVKLNNGAVVFAWDNAIGGVYRLFNFGSNSGNSQCEQALAAAQMQIASLQNQVSALTQQNQTLQQQNSQLQSQLADANQSISRLNNLIASLQNQINALMRENAQLRDEKNRLQTQLNQALQQIRSLQDQLDSCVQLNSQLQNQIAALTEQNAQLKDQLAAANALIQNQQNQIAALMQANQTLNASIGNLIAAIEHDFQKEFKDPQFKIPGNTPVEQLQNIVNAILNLNHGQKQALYKKLGGKK